MVRRADKVILVGNVDGNPKTRYTPSGDVVTNITLATNKSQKDRQTGQRQKRIEWRYVMLSGRLTKIAGKYLHKGSQVYIEDDLRIRRRQGQDGQGHCTTEIVVGINGNM